jgi:protein SCO1
LMIARLRSAAVMLTLVLILAACSPLSGSDPPIPSSSGSARGTSSGGLELHGTLIDPPFPPPTQILSDTSGQPVSVAGRARDSLTLLFFGYTHCHDACPTIMADLATARRLLPVEVRDRVTVLFVTEDPERDTPAVLRRWLDRIDPSFVGLIGGNDASKAMLKQLYLPETTRNAHPTPAIRHGDGHAHDEHGSYGLDHTGVVYGFSPQGRAVIYTGGTTPTEYAADFNRLLAESR